MENVSVSVAAKALEITADAAGLPKALWTTSSRSLRNETSALSLYAPRTILNQTITGSRRFAAQDWPLERMRGVMQGDRRHHQRRGARHVQRRHACLPARADALPDNTLIAMVPIGLKAKHVAARPRPTAATPSAR